MSIGEDAFLACTSLARVTIGKGVIRIGNSAFCDCYGVESVTFTGAVTQWNAITKGEFWILNILATEVVCSDGTVAL